MHVQFAPADEDIPLASIGNTRNIGDFVVAALQQPEKTLPGRYVSASIEDTSMRKLLDDWSEVTGKEAIYIQISMDAYDRLWPGWAVVEGTQFLYMNEYRNGAWPLKGVLTASDLGVDTTGMDGIQDTLRKMQL